MIPQKQQALLKEQGYRWLASFLCLWLAVAYLWLAIFYPLVCAPYTSSSSYTPIHNFNAFEHTITPFSLVMSVPILWPDDATQYLRSSASASHLSWLMDSSDDASGPVMTFINAISVPDLPWLQPLQPLQTIALLQPESYKQFNASPPERPPRLSPVK